jgi:hypothetical protein
VTTRAVDAAVGNAALPRRPYYLCAHRRAAHCDGRRAPHYRREQPMRAPSTDFLTAK